MRKIVLLFIFFLLLFPLKVFSYEDVVFIHDDSSLLKEDTFIYLEETSYFLKDNLDLEYYLFTVSNLNGISIEKYALQLFDEFNISNRSIIILYAKSEREIHVHVGSELSSVISNDTIQKHIDNFFIPFLKYGEYDQGLKNGYNSFYKLICNSYHLDIDNIIVYNSLDFKYKYKAIILLFIYWICTLFAYVFCSFFKNKFLTKKNNLTMSLIFLVSLFVNIYLFILVYSIEKKYLYVLLFLELLSILSALYIPASNLKNNKKKKK